MPFGAAVAEVYIGLRERDQVVPDIHCRTSLERSAEHVLRQQHLSHNGHAIQYLAFAIVCSSLLPRVFFVCALVVSCLFLRPLTGLAMLCHSLLCKPLLDIPTPYLVACWPHVVPTWPMWRPMWWSGLTCCCYNTTSCDRTGAFACYEFKLRSH
jgi:hypothetical protein